MTVATKRRKPKPKPKKKARAPKRAQKAAAPQPSPLTVQCPACGAGPGKLCKERGRPVEVHLRRRIAANDAKPGAQPRPVDDRSFDCPACGAPAGKVCRSTERDDGIGRGNSHKERYALAAGTPARSKPETLTSTQACLECDHVGCPIVPDCSACAECQAGKARAIEAKPVLGVPCPKCSALAGEVCRGAPPLQRAFPAGHSERHAALKAGTPAPAGNPPSPPVTNAVELLIRTALRRDGGTQPRASIDRATVETYAEDIRAGAQMPPLVVFHDGEAYWLADGFHRLEALELAGRMVVECEVRQGTRRDAILYSVGANAYHGLRRSSADKRRAVETLLRDDEWGRRSDRWIAESCAVDHKTVGKVRAELAAVGKIPSASTRETQDGRDHPASQPSRPPASSTRVDYDGEGHPDEEASTVDERPVEEDLHDGYRERGPLEQAALDLDSGKRPASPPAPKPEERSAPVKRTWRQTLGLPESGSLGPLEVVAAYDAKLGELDRNDGGSRLELQRAKAFGLSQWHTKPELAKRMAELSNVVSLARMRWEHSGRPLRILEPSAGAGGLCAALGQVLRASASGSTTPRKWAHITAHEVDPARCVLLQRHADVDEVIAGDFLTSSQPEDLYDLAIANTPSERGLDGLFLEEMMRRSNRVLVLLRVNALCGTGRLERVWSQVQRREWALLELRFLAERPEYLIGSDESSTGELESEDGAQSDYCVAYLARNPPADPEDEAEPDLTGVDWL